MWSLPHFFCFHGYGHRALSIFQYLPFERAMGTQGFNLHFLFIFWSAYKCPVCSLMTSSWCTFLCFRMRSFIFGTPNEAGWYGHPIEAWNKTVAYDLFPRNTAGSIFSTTDSTWAGTTLDFCDRKATKTYMCLFCSLKYQQRDLMLSYVAIDHEKYCFHPVIIKNSASICSFINLFKGRQ